MSPYFFSEMQTVSDDSSLVSIFWKIIKWNKNSIFFFDRKFEALNLSISLMYVK